MSARDHAHRHVSRGALARYLRRTHPEQGVTEADARQEVDWLVVYDLVAGCTCVEDGPGCSGLVPVFPGGWPAVLEALRAASVPARLDPTVAGLARAEFRYPFFKALVRAARVAAGLPQDPFWVGEGLPEKP